VINLVAKDVLAKLKVGYIELKSEILNDNRKINDMIPKVKSYYYMSYKIDNFNICILL
jgi:hypothetical protein